MKRWHAYILFALFTFSLGAAGAWLLLQPPASPTIRCPEQPPQPEHPPQLEVRQTKSSEPSADLRQFDLTHIDITNPYDIAASLDGLTEGSVVGLWKRLGIAGRYNSVEERQNFNAFFTDCDSCKAETFEFDLDGDAENEVILRVANGMEECRYLIFKKVHSKQEYKLVGHFDHNFGRYEMPVHHFVLSKGKAYMVVRVQAASGSGVAAYTACILALKKGRLTELMSFPSDGSQSMFETLPSREYGGRVLDISESGRDTRIELGLTVKYELYGQNNKVTSSWTKHAKAVYIKPAGKREAYLDRAASTISQEQIDAEYNVDSLSDEDLLRFNHSQLNAAGWKLPGTR